MTTVEGNYLLSLILQKEMSRHRELKHTAEVYTASTWQG